MEIILITVFVLYVIAMLAYFAKRTNKVFVIKIHHQTVKVTKGQPTHAFVRECEEIAKIRKNIKGKIYGIREQGALNFHSQAQLRIQRDKHSETCGLSKFWVVHSHLIQERLKGQSFHK